MSEELKPLTRDQIKDIFDLIDKAKEEIYALPHRNAVNALTALGEVLHRLRCPLGRDGAGMTHPAAETQGPVLALIERLERATGPDRELDHAIQMVVYRETISQNMAVTYFDTDPDFAKKYTASIDAALTLLGPNPEYEITTLYGVARVGINLNHGDDGSPFYGERLDGNVPIALCTAALKARSA